MFEGKNFNTNKLSFERNPGWNHVFFLTRVTLKWMYCVKEVAVKTGVHTCPQGSSSFLVLGCPTTYIILGWNKSSYIQYHGHPSRNMFQDLSDIPRSRLPFQNPLKKFKKNEGDKTCRSQGNQKIDSDSSRYIRGCGPDLQDARDHITCLGLGIPIITLICHWLLLGGGQDHTQSVISSPKKSHEKENTSWHKP